VRQQRAAPTRLSQHVGTATRGRFMEVTYNSCLALQG